MKPNSTEGKLPRFEGEAWPRRHRTTEAVLSQCVPEERGRRMVRTIVAVGAAAIAVNAVGRQNIAVLFQSIKAVGRSVRKLSRLSSPDQTNQGSIHPAFGSPTPQISQCPYAAMIAIPRGAKTEVSSLLENNRLRTIPTQLYPVLPDVTFHLLGHLMSQRQRAINASCPCRVSRRPVPTRSPMSMSAWLEQQAYLFLDSVTISCPRRGERRMPGVGWTRLILRGLDSSRVLAHR